MSLDSMLRRSPLAGLVLVAMVPAPAFADDAKAPAAAGEVRQIVVQEQAAKGEPPGWVVRAAEGNPAPAHARDGQTIVIREGNEAGEGAGEGVTVRINEDGRIETTRGSKSAVPAPPAPGGDGRLPLSYGLPRFALRTDAGEAAEGNQTYLGIAVSPATEALRAQLGLAAGTGLVVDTVVPGSPAQQAGLERFDVLQKLDEQILINSEQLSVLVHAHKPGESVRFAIVRHAQPNALTAKLSGGPAVGWGGMMMKNAAVATAQPWAVYPPGAPVPAENQPEQRMRAELASKLRELQLRQAEVHNPTPPNAPGDGLERARRVEAQMAQLDFEAARLQLEKQRIHAEELKKAAQNGAVPESELRNAMLDVQLAEVQLKRAEARLAMIRSAGGPNPYTPGPNPYVPPAR